MNRQTSFYVPFALGAAVLLWLVLRNWPKPGTVTRADEVDRMLDEISTPAPPARPERPRP